jgi:hypothetical protein
MRSLVFCNPCGFDFRVGSITPVQAARVPRVSNAGPHTARDVGGVGNGGVHHLIT